MKSKTLQEILSIIIIIGNFLNSGGYAGNAAGIKLSSLTKLTEIKANKTGMHLLHLIALEVQRYNPDLLDLSNELNILESVSKINNDQIEKDIKDMELDLDSIKKQIYSSTTEADIKHQMNEFIKEADAKMEILIKQIVELKSLRIEMAEFFCEDLTTFKVDECFEIFYKFCEQFKQALKENEKRQQLEMQASIRQEQKEQQLAQKCLTAPAHNTTKRLRQRSAKKSSIVADNTNTDINSKRNEDDLMAFLQNSNRTHYRKKETNRKTRLDKRPDLLKFNFERERDQHSSNFVENSPAKCIEISKTPRLVDHKKTNLIQKSWKRLMEGCKASQLRDDSSKPEISSKRERLQIFIRSNSTIDNTSGQPKNQASITFIKTALPKSCSAFNFSAQDIQASQAKIIDSVTENLVEEKSFESLDGKSRLCLEIAPGIDTNPTKEESTVEIKHSRVKLKTMASIVELGCRYSSINEEDLKSTIKNLRTPTLEKSPFCFSPSTLKSNNWNWDQRPQVLNSVDEENPNLDLNTSLEYNNEKPQQAVKPAQNELVQEERLKTIELENPKKVSKVQSKQEITSRECCEAAAVIENKEDLTNDPRKTKGHFSKLLVSKLQDKIRALSPTRLQATENQEKIPSHIADDEEAFFGPRGLNKINMRSSSSETVDKNPTDKPFITVSNPSIEVQKASNSKKSFVSRLQSKIRALSPLKVQPEQVANFQSYVNFENDATKLGILKSKSNIQPETDLQKQESRKNSITKGSSPKEQLFSKDVKNQRRLSRHDSSISNCPTKTNIPKTSLPPAHTITQKSKIAQQNVYQDTSTSKIVKPVLRRVSPNTCKTKKDNIGISKTKKQPTLAQNKMTARKPHCQDLSVSSSCKKYNTNLINQTKVRSSSCEARKLNQQANTNSRKSDLRRLSNTTSKSLPSKIVPAYSTVVLEKRNTTANSKQMPNKRRASLPTSTNHNRSIKSANARTNSSKEHLKNLPNLKASVSKTHSTSKSDVKRSSLQSNCATSSSQPAAITSNNSETFSRLSSAGKNGKKLTFSEICQIQNGLCSNTKPDKTVNKANNPSSTSLCSKIPQGIVVNTGTTKIKPTATSHTKEQNFKRPCRKFQ